MPSWKRKSRALLGGLVRRHGGVGQPQAWIQIWQVAQFQRPRFRKTTAICRVPWSILGSLPLLEASATYWIAGLAQIRGINSAGKRKSLEDSRCWSGAVWCPEEPFRFSWATSAIQRLPLLTPEKLRWQPAQTDLNLTMRMNLTIAPTAGPAFLDEFTLHHEAKIHMQHHLLAAFTTNDDVGFLYKFQN